MNIVICTDANYIMPCGIMIKSLCENNKDDSIIFYFIINDSVKETHREQLIQIVEPYGNKRIEFIYINDDIIIDLPIPIKRYTKSVYYRLYLADLLPNSIHKVLFLDGDIIVRNSLKALWETDISDFAVGVIPDMGDANMSFFNRLQYDSSKGYFNGGVLLINLDYWRNHNVLPRLLNYLKDYPERIVLNDQDVMNVVLQDEKKKLPLKYNMQEGFLYKHNTNFEWRKYQGELSEALTNPTIIHFTHEIKPWHKECPHPYKNEFLKYKDMTIWKDTPLLEFKQDIPKGLIRKFVFYYDKYRGYPIYNPYYIDIKMLNSD